MFYLLFKHFGPFLRKLELFCLNRWFYFFINIPRTLNEQFLQLDLEFSSTQRKSFFRYIQIWRRPIWMVVFTQQMSTKILQLLYFLLCMFPAFEQKQRRTLSLCLSIYRIHKKNHIMFEFNNKYKNMQIVKFVQSDFY